MNDEQLRLDTRTTIDKHFLECMGEARYIEHKTEHGFNDSLGIVNRDENSPQDGGEG